MLYSKPRTQGQGRHRGDQKLYLYYTNASHPSMDPLVGLVWIQMFAKALQKCHAGFILQKITPFHFSIAGSEWLAFLKYVCPRGLGRSGLNMLSRDLLFHGRYVIALD